MYTTKYTYIHICIYITYERMCVSVSLALSLCLDFLCRVVFVNAPPNVHSNAVKSNCALQSAAAH